MAKGIFQRHTKGLVAYGGQPLIGDMLWIDPITNITYCYDVVRTKWLSAEKPVFEYARKGAAKGVYLPLLGDLDDTDDVYMPNRPSTVLGIFCRSKSGDAYTEFALKKNTATIYTFSYNGNADRTFLINDLNLNIEPTDKIQVYVSKSSSAIINTVCRVETAWRYDI
ncbi:MAG TPA: hypothetical protein VI911_08055 [Patescibacteria group bacterium]|nr:hypothetical protein [Patescibacteria group bacterium]